MVKINIKIPNNETLQALQETDTGTGFTTHKDLKELFKDLGLDNKKHY